MAQTTLQLIGWYNLLVLGEKNLYLRQVTSCQKALEAFQELVVALVGMTIAVLVVVLLAALTAVPVVAVLAMTALRVLLVIVAQVVVQIK